MIAVLVLHFALAAVLPALGRRMGRPVLYAAALAPALALGYALVAAPLVMNDGPIVTDHSWVPGLGLSFRLALDGFALLMVGIVSFVGVLILVYARGYASDDATAGKLAGLLVAFAGSMLGLVTADDLFMLFVFWELTSITSYLLIGLEDHLARARAAALQALLVTGTGGLAMLAGLVLIGQAAGTTSLSAILADPPSGTTAAVGLGLVLVGAFTKSAQVPFHFWLPGAMAAPTPVSAYLHSATMVKAGIFLVARLAPAFAAVAMFWRPTVMAVGLATMLLGGYRALQQHDMKLLLAYGTVSQLGFLMMLYGAGTPELTLAATLMLVAHSLFKATLFLVTGIVDHEYHTRDLRHLHHVRLRLPWVAAAATIAGASMAGLPLLAGFVAKEEALAALFGWDELLALPLLVGVVVGSALTTAYTLRFVVGGFFSPGEPHADVTGAARVELSMAIPVGVLTGLTIVFGVWPAVLDPFIATVVTSLDPEAAIPHLAAWHGIDAAFMLSVLAVGSGWFLWKFPGLTRRVQRVTGLVPDASRVYARSLGGLTRLATRVTAITQSGSLPIYIGVILFTMLLVSGPPLVRAWAIPDEVVWSLSPVQAAVVGLVVVAAVGTARAVGRLTAVLWLGTVGYGVAVLMVLQGAPDVGLTQMLVETMMVVIFVLVLRHLPGSIDQIPWRARQSARLAISVGVGLFAAVFAFLASAPNPIRAVSQEMSDLALPEAGGRNIVNVILTDFRALDTLGEITVVAVAAIGILALVRPGRRPEEEQE